MVERHLAKVNVARSNRVTRFLPASQSISPSPSVWGIFFCGFGPVWADVSGPTSLGLAAEKLTGETNGVTDIDSTIPREEVHQNWVITRLRILARIS